MVNLVYFLMSDVSCCKIRGNCVLASVENLYMWKRWTRCVNFLNSSFLACGFGRADILTEIDSPFLLSAHVLEVYTIDSVTPAKAGGPLWGSAGLLRISHQREAVGLGCRKGRAKAPPFPLVVRNQD